MTEQEKRKKIIEGLEDFIQCYIDAFDDGGCAPLVAALDLRKPQEPRALTIDEIAAVERGVPLWIETNNMIGWAMVVWVNYQEICFPSYGFNGIFFMLKDYGKKFRCWTAIPTDEQRKAVPLNG